MRRTQVMTGLAALVAAAAGGLMLAFFSRQGTAQEPGPPAMDMLASGFRIEFGILEKELTLWEGEVSVSGGEVLRLDLWEPGADARVDGARFSVRAGGPGKKKQAGLPQLFATIRAPAGAEVELKTNHGTARFRPSALSPAQSTAILDGAARAWRTIPAIRITVAGRDEGFPAAAAAPDGTVWIAYTAYKPGAPLDEKAIEARRFETLEPGPVEDNLFAAILTARAAEPPRLAPDTSPRPEAPAVHPSEREDVARMRAYRIEAGGKTYRLLRGEFHRHTEYTSHRDQDGGLEEMWRYGLDGAAMEWIGNGDHDNGYGREYAWWVIQKVTDIFHHAPYFVPPFTYERSVVYPNGHRNVMFARRGVRPLPRGGLPGTAEEGAPDTKLLYAYLRHFGGICSVHTSATNMGTDWRDNDPQVEPVVEIYQGLRHNYEHSGAPRSATPETQIGGYQPAGFVWNAWARGHRLGVQSSSDHVSTHMSYAVAIAEAASREALLDAFRRRHTYGATDNIVLDVRAGDHLMGDEFTSSEPVRLRVRAIGTGPIRRIVVIKNNGYVYETAPRAREVDFTWQDVNTPAEPRQAPSSLHYYYVRLEQEDGQLAWSSPIWVRYQ